MTEKKEQILSTALELFAVHGFDGTSTAKVAKEAGVSEGLIFRHFTYKHGLLDALMKQGGEKVAFLYKDIFSIKDPKAKLHAVLSLPFKIPKDDYPFWRLLFTLKWQAQVYDDTFTRPIKQQLVAVFKELGYKAPKSEADTVLLIQDGVATALILRNTPNKKALLACILAKYNIHHSSDQNR
jgi:AcrR family transcriptional regulator